MPADPPTVKIPSLIEIGTRVINACYLIMHDQTGKPDPSAEVDLYLESGIRVHLSGDEARLWLRRIRNFIVTYDDEPRPASGTTRKIRKRRDPGPIEGG